MDMMPSTKKHTSSTLFTKDKGGQELSPPTDAIPKGFSEVARIWRKEEGEGELILVNLRALYTDSGGWDKPLTTFARAIASTYSNDTPDSDSIDARAFVVLSSAAESIPDNDQIEEMREGAEAFDPSTHMGATSLADIHPGLISIPHVVMEDAEYLQVVSIWHLPAVTDCPDCEEDHKSQTYISGNSGVMTGDLFGRLLADLASAHAGGTTKSEPARLMLLSSVEKAFHDRLMEGLARA